MKINNISNKTTSINLAQRNKSVQSGNFSTCLEFANKEQQEEQLKNMLKDIEVLGRKLMSTRSLEDAKEYKKKIQEYLNGIVKNIYVIKKVPGPFNYGVHVKIEVINQKLENLTNELINNQRENLNLADKIEEIKGLLVDVYK